MDQNTNIKNSISELLNSEEDSARKQAIEIIVEKRNGDFFEQLSRLAGSDPNEEIRYQARKALDQLEAEKFEGEKISCYQTQEVDCLLSSEDPYARFAGLQKIFKAGKEGQSKYHSLIHKALAKEGLVQLKARFILALGIYQLPEDIHYLSQYLSHKDSRIRANTIESLTNIGTEDAYRFIIPCISDPDNRVKTNVIMALKSFGGPAVYSLLNSMASDTRVWFRESAIYAYKKLKSPQALVALGEIALKDAEESVRKKALEALKQQKGEGNPVADEILLNIERAGLKASESLDVIAAQKLEKKPPKELAIMIESEDPSSRYIAICQLRKEFSKDEEGMFLKAFFKESDPFLLAFMTAFAGKYKILEAKEYLVNLLSHPDDRVRANAVEAIDKIDVNSAVDKLLNLLEDKSSMVVANSIIALSRANKVDAFIQTRRMIVQGRESFRRAALNIIIKCKEAPFVSLLEILLEDPNPTLRDEAFEVLKSFALAHVPGALKLLQDVENRINLENSKDNFFQNSLDQAFSDVLLAIQAGEVDENQKKRKPNNPEKEKKALLQLAETCLQLEIFDPKFKIQIQKLSDDLEAIEKLAEKSRIEFASKEGSIEEATKVLTEAELLNVEKIRIQTRKELMLCSAAYEIWSNKQYLEAEKMESLSQEFHNFEQSMCAHIPDGQFSVLPPENAPISEIFDVTMRLFQKHVWKFSIETIKKAIFWLVYIFIFSFFFIFFKRIGKTLLGFYTLFAAPVFIYGSLGLFSEWKTLLALLVDDFIHGRTINEAEFSERVASKTPYVLKNSVKKYIFLGLWTAVGVLFGSVVVSSGEMYDDNMFLGSIFKLLGVIVAGFIFSINYFKYQLIEPLCIFIPGQDAFLIAERIYSQNRIKMAMLFAFSTFIMFLVTGASMELFSMFLPLLPGNSGEHAMNLLASISQICLIPLVYLNMVIYTLMKIRDHRI